MRAPSVSPSNRYVWRVEDKPVAVHLSLDVVTRMQPLLACPPGVRMPEQGGILLGQVRRVNESWIVAVDDFVESECEHMRGASWTLSSRDRQQLARQLRRLKRKGTVGWFRTHTRPGLFLDQYDFRLFSEFFSHPECIALAIRPDPVKVAEAGFFFWENGDVRRAAPYSTFAFRSEELARAAETVPGRPAPPEPPRHQPAVPRPVPARSATVAVARTPKLWTWMALPAMSVRRKALYAAPVAAGLAAGFLWHPRVVKDTAARANVAIEGRTAAPAAERAVFGPPPDPEPAAVTPAAAPAVPPEIVPQEPRQERGRQAAPVRKLVIADSGRRAVPEPKLDFRPPEVSVAARLEQQPLIPAPAPPRVAATVEPVRVSVVRRAVGSIPGLGFLKRRKHDEAFVPPRPIRQIQPNGFALQPDDEPVRVKVTVDESGEVASAEVLSRKVEPALARAAVEAAWKWRFAPARVDDKPVSAQLILSFGVAPAASRGI
jgi:TonB family protein